ncbi:peptide deformylase [Kitasatospora sp. NPDC052896]|uniref:peptide deformylase n=1 Tax=Kitasatospora sp. NPDC052896 TaxID=3364061 RepID=UPI0037C891A3
MAWPPRAAQPSDRRVHVLGRPADTHPYPAPEAERGRVLRITEVGEDILHRPCRPATEFGTAQLSQLIDDMFLTMYVARGAGLAANQVGVDLRLFVYDCADDDGVRHVGHILNPVLDEPTGPRRLIDVSEGCLSVPGPRRGLGRADHTVVRGLDKDGNPLVIEGTGYFARCLQHESDHLDGMLYIDRLPKRVRREVLAETAEQRAEVHAQRHARAEDMGARHARVGDQQRWPTSPAAS